MDEIKNTVKPGFYKHYKGGCYDVIGIGKHSETQEQLVIYKHVYTNEIWIRPLTMFIEKITVDNKLIKRFERIDNLPIPFHQEAIKTIKDNYGDSILPHLAGTND